MYEDFVKERITQLRLKKGVSEYQMSYDLGHSRGYVYNISSGKALPPLKEFFAICDYFEINTNNSYRKLSRGMKIIVSNIIGICSNAQITIFDEPTIGLDADNREEFYKILLDSYIKNPRTIIISTHLINEVENLIENAEDIKKFAYIDTQILKDKKF